jgi:hypothetical protein
MRAARAAKADTGFAGQQPFVGGEIVVCGEIVLPSMDAADGLFARPPMVRRITRQ